MTGQNRAANFALSEVLVKCRALSPSSGFNPVKDYVENLLRAVLDSELTETEAAQAISYYDKNVRSTIRIHAELAALLAQNPDTKEGNRHVAQFLWGNNSWTQARALRGLVTYLQCANVTTQEQLEKWADLTDYKQLERHENAVSGIPCATVERLQLQLGLRIIVPDARLHKFLFDAMGREVSDIEAVDILRRVASQLNVIPSELKSHICRREKTGYAWLARQASKNKRWSHWITPVTDYDEQGPMEMIRKLVGEEKVFAFTDRNHVGPGIRSGDSICFYATDVGVVAHATVASRPDRMELPELRHPEDFPWGICLRDVELYLHRPVVIDVALRQRLGAFKDKSVDDWEWLVRVTHGITPEDFALLTR
jgi:hypothetical protein